MLAKFIELLIHYSFVEIEHYFNYDLHNIVTPLNVQMYERLLIQSDYDPVEVKFLVDGFKNGFDIGYKGPENRRSEAKNIPFTVGNKEEMWTKIMKEVKAKRFQALLMKSHLTTISSHLLG